MKANKSLMSALLGVALLAMPIAAAASPSANPNEGNRNRGFAPTYNSYRQAPAPRVAANNRLWMTPVVPIRDHDDRRWRDRDDGWKSRDRDDWRHGDHDRDDRWSNGRTNDRYRRVCDQDGDDCRNVPRAHNLEYREGDRPDRYQGDSYNYGVQNYGAPVRGGLANLIRQRDNAQLLYQQALRNGNRVRAKHLHNDIVDLNKQIGGAEQRG